jgi:pimeloyl-ACP methyl ester carboxylesterase
MKNLSQRYFKTNFKFFFGIVFVFLFCSPLLTSCSFLQVKKDVEFIHNSSVLVGNISISPDEKSPVVVIAYTKHWRKIKIAHYTVLHEPGSYELLVPKGNYHIFAFADKNGNLVYDKGEPSGYFGQPDTVSAPAGGVISCLDFVISNKKDPVIDFPIGASVPPKKCGKVHSTLAGAVVNLDDEIFSESYGAKGYWDGVDFFKEVGGNIYFLEKYDPTKIPILFVHGAKGSPQNWKYFVDNMDRTRYQPWFFYYPSGASLKSMAHLLSKKLWDLQIKYHFDRLYITAHSMGGMVVRSFLLDHGKNHPYIKLFVSISTPWGGEKLADLGVNYSPAVIPSWLDMQPEGDFIKSMFREKLASNIDYYLLFGYRGSHNLLRPNNDGTVTLASQLDLRAQSEAKATYGFNEDHTSILTSKELLNQYKAILAATDKSFSVNSHRQGGNLKVRFSFETPDTVPKPQVFLLLKPDGDKGDKKILFLNSGDSGREFGAIPPGKYTARLVAEAFRAEPIKLPLSIESGMTSSINFVLKPQGMLSGYIGAVLKPGENTAGMYRSPDSEVSVESIIVEGDGIRRSLSPSKESIVDFFDLYFADTDFFQKGIFSFLDLPKGEYKLTIKADGYLPYTMSRRIVPGEFVNSRPIILTPLNSSD